MIATHKTTEYCPICQDTKPLEAFHRDPTKSSGHRYRCGECEQLVRWVNEALRQQYDDAHPFQTKKERAGVPNLLEQKLVARFGGPLTRANWQELRYELEEDLSVIKAATARLKKPSMKGRKR